MSKTCGSCKHWLEINPGYQGNIVGFGTCKAARQPGPEDYIDDDEAIDYRLPEGWLSCVVDGSGYFAALKTREAFGCVLWEASE